MKKGTTAALAGLAVFALVTCRPIGIKDPSCERVTSGYGPRGDVPVRAETVVDGLKVPWSVVFLPGGDLLITERPGRLRIARRGRLLPPIATIPVSPTGEGGLLGAAAHPDFVSNRLLYLYFTARVNGIDENRVERWRLSSDHRSAERERVILSGIPAGKYHDGGRLRFGPDGKLYVGTGDAREPDLSQSKASLAGKILRRVTTWGGRRFGGAKRIPTWCRRFLPGKRRCLPEAPQSTRAKRLRPGEAACWWARSSPSTCIASCWTRPVA